MNSMASTALERSPITFGRADAASLPTHIPARQQFATEPRLGSSTEMFIPHGGKVGRARVVPSELSEICLIRSNETISIVWTGSAGSTAHRTGEQIQFAVSAREGQASTYGIPDLRRVPTWKTLSPSSAPSAIGALPAWAPAVDEELRGLTLLPPGWDSYSARPISADTATAAMDLLRRVVQDDTPVPSIVPMSRGGIQLEWHLRGMNIEVTVPPRGSSVEVWYEDLRSGEEREFTIEDDPGALRDVLAELTRRG
jgi:hypothetical protein